MLWERPWACRLSETRIESRQFIGWWGTVKCIGLHARKAVFGISKLKFCKNLSLKTLHSRLDFFERSHPFFPRCAPEASAVLHKSATWGSDVELEAMDSEQMGLALSLPLSPEHVHTNSPFEFGMNIYILARRQATPFPSGYMMYCLLQRPTPRILGLL